MEEANSISVAIGQELREDGLPRIELTRDQLTPPKLDAGDRGNVDVAGFVIGRVEEFGERPLWRALKLLDWTELPQSVHHRLDKEGALSWQDSRAKLQW